MSDPQAAAIDLALRRRTWAVVGLSPDPRRDSHRIAALLQRRGHRVVPVNPRADEVLGERAYPSLADVPSEVGVEVVDVFRRSALAGAHVDEAIAAGASAAWLQLGVVDEAAGARARTAGLAVVMDRCPAIELARLGAAAHRRLPAGRSPRPVPAVPARRHPPWPTARSATSSSPSTTSSARPPSTRRPSAGGPAAAATGRWPSTTPSARSAAPG